VDISNTSIYSAIPDLTLAICSYFLDGCKEMIGRPGGQAGPAADPAGRTGGAWRPRGPRKKLAPPNPPFPGGVLKKRGEVGASFRAGYAVSRALFLRREGWPLDSAEADRKI